MIVKTPMDLGTVRKKLMNNKYETVEAVFDDIQLIWDNCKTYNQVGSVADCLFSGSTALLKNSKDPSKR